MTAGKIIPLLILMTFTTDKRRYNGSYIKLFLMDKGVWFTLLRRVTILAADVSFGMGTSYPFLKKCWRLILVAVNALPCLAMDFNLILELFSILLFCLNILNCNDGKKTNGYAYSKKTLHHLRLPRLKFMVKV